MLAQASLLVCSTTAKLTYKQHSALLLQTNLHADQTFIGIEGRAVCWKADAFHLIVKGTQIGLD